MKYALRILFLPLLIILFNGCAAIGVPVTNDPGKKLAYAYQMFDKEQRPLPAEKLIREAIDIYKNQNNEIGLAEAYRAYGFFFRSAAIKKWEKHYKSDGFLEEGATFENRYNNSINYFEKAEKIYSEKNKYDALTNIYLNMGFTYEFAGENQKACDSYKKSMASNQEHMKLNPDASMTLPEGFNSYREYAEGHLKRLNCN